MAVNFLEVLPRELNLEVASYLDDLVSLLPLTLVSKAAHKIFRYKPVSQGRLIETCCLNGYLELLKWILKTFPRDLSVHFGFEWKHPPSKPNPSRFHSSSPVLDYRSISYHAGVAMGKRHDSIVDYLRETFHFDVDPKLKVDVLQTRGQNTNPKMAFEKLSPISLKRMQVFWKGVGVTASASVLEYLLSKLQGVDRIGRECVWSLSRTLASYAHVDSLLFLLDTPKSKVMELHPKGDEFKNFLDVFFSSMALNLGHLDEDELLNRIKALRGHRLEYAIPFSQTFAENVAQNSLIKVLDYGLDYGLERVKHGKYLFRGAITFGRLEMLKALFERNVTSDGALGLAVVGGNTEIVTFLFKSGAKSHISRLFATAVAKGRLEMLDCLWTLYGPIGTPSHFNTLIDSLQYQTLKALEAIESVWKWLEAHGVQPDVPGMTAEYVRTQNLFALKFLNRLGKIELTDTLIFDLIREATPTLLKDVQDFRPNLKFDSVSARAVFSRSTINDDTKLAEIVSKHGYHFTREDVVHLIAELDEWEPLVRFIFSLEKFEFDAALFRACETLKDPAASLYVMDLLVEKGCPKDEELYAKVVGAPKDMFTVLKTRRQLQVYFD